ncbi:MAG: DUF4157 domain-containing protein [Caldimonas sp.]
MQRALPASWTTLSGRAGARPTVHDDPAAESEADRMAEGTRAPAPTGCACGGGCPRCRARPAASASNATPAAEGSLQGGAPLRADERAAMESKLGASFGSVRVHDDANAQAASAALQAQAFTYGEHVVFGAGRRGDSGLLAHELAHVVQQRRGAGARVQRKPNDAAAAPGVDPQFWEWWKGVVGFEGSLEQWKANPANVNDAGGQTNWGVTKSIYMGKAKALGLDPTEAGFKALTPEGAMRFGHMQWVSSGASRIKNTGVALVIADWYWGGIDLGRLTAILKAKGFDATYDMGSPSQATTDFINTLPPGDLIEQMSDSRAEQFNERVKTHPKDKDFLKGWLDRNAKRRTQARAFVPALSPAPAPEQTKPQVSLWDQAQQALRAAGQADTPEQIEEAERLVLDAIDAIDDKEAAGFRDDEEKVSLTDLRNELYDADTDLSGR